MNHFTIYNSEGRILRTGIAPPGQLEIQVQEEGEFLLLSRSDPSYQYIEDGLVRNMPPKPSEYHTFDYKAKAWEDTRTLAEMQAQKWEEVKKARDAAEVGGFEWNGYRFQSDGASQAKLLSYAQITQIHPDFEVEWTLADNSVITLDAATLSFVVASLGEHLRGTHDQGRALRAQIFADDVTKEQLALIKF